MLVLEADYSSRDLLAQILTTAGYRVAVAPDGNTGLLLAQKLDADVVLLDYHLVDPTGLEVLKGLREQAGAPVTTVLLFKSDDSPSVITEALHHGATNFALRPFEPVELLMRIHQAQFAEAERADLLRRNAQLEQSGSIDWLTGLPNRAYVYRELVRVAGRARRWHSTLTVMVIDVDRFKEINDHFGHAAGDTALRWLADLLHDTVRIEDVIGRLGGDEFLLVAPDTDERGAFELAERIRARVKESVVDGPDGRMRMTVTIGFASGLTVDPGALVRAADAALYAGKAAGRDRVSAVQGHLTDKDSPITVMIVDDHRMVAEGLARLIEREDDMLVAAVVETAKAAVDVTRVIVPNVILLDHRLPDSDGVTTARVLRQIAPDVRVLLVTGYGSDEVLLDAIDAGCSGYLDKTRASVELVGAIRLAHAGEIVMAPAELQRLVPMLPRADHRTLEIFLTETEQEILSLSSKGLDNHQIAEHLGLRANQVHRDVQSLMARLDVHSKLEAVAAATRDGLIETAAGN
jgi:diguanylate cyclase (GGDEF)-like protein